MEREPEGEGGGAEHGHAGQLALLLGCGILLGVALVGKLGGFYDPAVADLVAAVGAIPLAIPIVWDAAKHLAKGESDLHELIALSVLAGIGFGDYLTAGGLALFAMLGELAEERTAFGAHTALQSLLELAPRTARRLLEGGEEQEVPAAEVRPGDRLRVLPGEQVPADGRILSGMTALDEKLLTGESLPVERGPGGEVFAGTLNTSGAIEIEVEKAGDDTTLAQVQDLIGKAESSRPPLARTIDRVVENYLPITIAIAVLVLFFTRDAERFMAVLVILGPSALVLATPTASVAALAAAARLGVLVKDARTLEQAADLSHVVFDKTGTVTDGVLHATRASFAPRLLAEPHLAAETLRLAASLASRSTHPASRAVHALAREAELELVSELEVEEVPGYGLVGEHEGRRLLLGRLGHLERHGVEPQAFDRELREADDDQAQSLLFFAVDGQPVATFAIQDTIRPEAPELVASLRELGVRRLALLTGDRWPVARRVAARLGLDEVVAECLPAQKLELVEGARTGGVRIAMVGDGVNDGPALAAADLGIAMGAAGSDVAMATAQVVLMSDDLRRVGFLVRLGRDVRAVVIQNLLGALLLIGCGLGLAAAGLLAPIPAMILHNAGDLFVILNSARLFRAGEELLDAEPAAKEGQAAEPEPRAAVPPVETLVPAQAALVPLSS